MAIEWVSVYKVVHEVIDSASKIAAVGIGAWWTYRAYKLEKPHVYRLQAEVTAAFKKRYDHDIIVVECRLRNLGKVACTLEREGTGLWFSMLRPEEPKDFPINRRPEQDEKVAFRVFTTHEEVGPGLTLSEQILVPKPQGSYDGCWAQLRVETRHPKGNQACGLPPLPSRSSST